MAKPTLTLEDLIAGQKKLAEDQNRNAQSQERISIAQLKKLANIETLQRQDRNLQAIEDVETRESNKLENLMADDLQKGLLDKGGDGLNANVIKMAKSIDKLTRLFEEQKKAADTLQKVGERREFRTLGQRFSGMKESAKDFFTLRGFLDKTGIVRRKSGGLFSEALDAREDRQKYAQARLAAGDPTARIHGREGARQIFEKQRGEQQQLIRQKNDLEGKIDEYRRLNVPEAQIAQSPEAKQLQALAAKFEKVDPSVRGRTAEPKASPQGPTEASIEQSEFQQDELDVLNKIEENTRPSNQLKPKDKEGKGDGFLSGLGRGLKGAAGALGDAAKGILAFAASLWIISKAFGNFAELDWSGITKGLVAMGAFAVAIQFIKDSDASKTLLAFGAALWITSKAFSNFAELDWSGLAKGLVVVGAMTAAVIAIGALGPVVMAGAATLLALGAALWLASKAFENVAESMDKFTEGLSKLSEIDGANLLTVAAGIGAVGTAMAAFGVGQAVAGLGNLVSGLLSIGQDSPVEQLERIAATGDGISKAADGLERMAAALTKFNDVDTSKVGKAVDATQKVAQVGSKAPAAKAPMTSIQEKPVEATLSGVTTEQIKSHPNYKKYFADAKSFGVSDAEAYQDAALQVKSDMAREQQVQPVAKVPQAANKVYNKSADNAAAAATPVAKTTPTQINAATQINNQNQTAVMKTPIRNHDSTLYNYFKTRFSI